ncbi:methyl-accepting chemotaxis protein [Sneathiella limimaris]|uniref:methyl-accepting chemotaxis protein n=1 Tax=Sneathiella limimaris TaxID=1964213 RepID=UPI00146A5F5C|nr:methyl-accepting chemotaxis protein [Sneathiella limimaris]
MKLRNLSISKKLLISPIIFVIALVVLGILSISKSQSNLDTMEVLYTQAESKNGAAYRFQRDLQAFNGNLFRLISQVGAGVDEAILAEFRKQLLAYLQGANKSLADFIENGKYSEQEITLLEKLQGELTEYGKDVETVIEMTEIDPATAVVMMVSADDKFKVLYKTIDELVKVWQAEGKDRFETAIADGESGVQQFIVISVLAFLIAAGVTFLVIRMIRVPVQNLTTVMSELSQGNKEVDVPNHEDKDEIGEMARAVLVFKENAIEQERLQAEAEKHAEEEAERERIAQEEKLKRETAEREREQREAAEKQARADHVAKLIADFEQEVSQVMETVSLATRELQATANTMSNTAGSSQELAEGVASASTEASQNVQTVASAAEELSSSINEISRQVQQANEVSEKAVVEASNSTHSVSTLADTAKKISEVVDMINDIAGQTNLLALNATIEAARAGDAGKGFAVVASEVKSLANQTARATEEIAQQINDMQNATESAVSAIANIDSVINSIRQSTVGISSAIEEQSAATNEISRNVQEASNGTNQVSQKIGTVSEKASETGAAAQEVQSASVRLDELSQKLKRDIEGFLHEVRVA